MKILKNESILDIIIKRNRLTRILFLCIGTFLVALFYNAYVVPNNLVYGGLGGIAIIVNEKIGVSTTLFINLVTSILIVLSFIILGFKKTSYTIVGFFVYAIMINVTTPLATLINIKFDSYLFSIIFYACLMGVGYGLIYKTGFNTGGSDTVIAIMQKYFKFPTARLSNIINGIIVVLGASTFGIVKSIYAIIFLKVLNYMSDRVVLGVSTNKLCFIKTRHLKDLEEFLTNELEVGYTLIDSTNGIGFLKKTIVMCVIPSDRFYDLKQELILLDKKAEIISNDCYTVEGGKTNRLIPV